jgi:murein DD-endopeptidase MepM/ murein hydrolase activator NlpD
VKARWLYALFLAALFLIGFSVSVQAGAVGLTQAPANCTYTVQPGDWLYKIARSHGISAEVLISMNPQLSDPNKIFPGQIINFPCPENSVPAAKAAQFQVSKEEASTLATQQIFGIKNPIGWGAVVALATVTVLVFIFKKGRRNQ